MNGQSTKRRRYVGPYILGKTIGEGSTAKVKLGRHKFTHEQVAIKILSRHQLTQEACTQVAKAFALSTHLRHPHIVEMKKLYITKEKLYIVMEYVHRGDLFSAIAQNGPYKEHAAKRIFQQLLDALHHCHQKGIYHRDLKPENILLTGEGDVKLSDFGLATFIEQSPEMNEMIRSICGTPNYLPPEAILEKEYRGAPADIWSLGVVLYVTLVGCLPFMDRSFPRLCKKIQNGLYKIPENVSDEGKDLLDKMICPDPTKRITIDRILQHPWMHSSSLPCHDYHVRSKSCNPDAEIENLKNVKVISIEETSRPEQKLIDVTSLFEEKTTFSIRKSHVHSFC